MSAILVHRTAALFAVALLVAPAAFMAYTPPAQALAVQETGAQLGFIEGILGQDTITAIKTAYSAVKEAITAVSAVTSAAKDTALVIERYVLQPLAYITTGNLLKKLTSSILGFIGGKNALGKPLYIQDMRAYVQNVGDVEAFSFLDQFQKNSNSPFASAITSSLRANYLQSTSLAGFFAANKSTLTNYSSDPNAFIGGNWGKGGWLAFLGLATVDQNNPYLNYYHVADQFSRHRQTAQTAKIVTAIGNQNYLNWCGSSGGTTAGGSGTVYDANGNPIDVTGTSDFNTSVGGDYGGGGAFGDQSDFGGGGDAVCPADTVPAGSGCACTNPMGCNLDEVGHPEFPADSFVLPVGYSCGQGFTFDGDTGGCRSVDTGELTYALDASGNPAVTPANLDSVNNDNNQKLSSSGSGSANAQQTVSALQSTSFYRSGTDQYGGNCGVAVRTALCNTEGGSFCNGLGSGGAGNWASVATPAGWTQAQTFTGVGSNSALLPNLQDGDVVQTMPIGVHSYGHVCYMYGGSCYSDTKQTNIVPYPDVRTSSSLKVVVWRAPAKTSLRAQNSNVAVAPGVSSVRTTGRVLAASTGYTNTSSTSGLKPGDPCTKSDGTSGRVQTPGSTLKTYLDNTLKATGLDKLIAGAGDLSTQINKIMGDVGAVMKTVDMATNLFGGSSSGLLAFSGDAGYTSPFADYLNSSSYMGLTTQNVYENAEATGVTSSDLAFRVDAYEAAWNKIGTAATTASTNLNNIINTCSAQASAAQVALDTWVTPALSDWAAAKASIVAAEDLIAKAAADAVSDTDTGAYANDIQLMTTQPPTATDVANIEAEADPLGTAKADPTGSVSNIAGGVTIDRLNLINTNAPAMLGNATFCPPPPPPPPAGGGGGGPPRPPREKARPTWHGAARAFS